MCMGVFCFMGDCVPVKYFPERSEVCSTQLLNVGPQKDLQDPTESTSFQFFPSNRMSRHSNSTSSYGTTTLLTRTNRNSSFTKGTTLQTRTNRNSSFTKGPTLFVSSQSNMSRPPSVQSQKSGLHDVLSMADLTLKEAVEFLSNPDEKYQQFGASFIQQTTFNDEQSKQEVLLLGGICPLVALLSSSTSAVTQSASAALRNLVFRDHQNKLEVQQAGGLQQALHFLTTTDCTMTQRHLAGLLWNMSSADELKEEILAEALPVLTESIIVPFSSWSESTNNHNIHPDVFYSATGCLRNLSCAQQEQRKRMRECNGLIDSLMMYVRSCVAEDKPDDKSVENCVCILHNLTYQLEEEAPQCFSRFHPTTDASSVKNGGKNTDVFCCSLWEEDYNPVGVAWLTHSKGVQIYLNLLSSAQKDSTLEACCGALQNLTANRGLVSIMMSHTIVQKLGGLQYIAPLLQSPNPGLQKTAMSLVGNLSRTISMQSIMALHILPDLSVLLSSGTKGMANCDQTMATACHVLRSLILADTVTGRKFITKHLVTSLADLSENRLFQKASKAASLVLYNLWQQKSLQSTVKKLGMAKSLFVNETTRKDHMSLQV
ncbi:plakophilin-1 isoform X2 [Esox lucius]|uniref:plakophilin-1 isoform X2 n=1 Tax=Esox lucius TaxID=8010 RepID=UPI0009732474|nr:plakophilin-1 isoform X2 [Esox lucius]